MANLYGIEKINDLKPCSRGTKSWGVRRKSKPVKQKTKKPRNYDRIQVIE